jgi:phosphopantetheinyl transferase
MAIGPRPFEPRPSVAGVEILGADLDDPDWPGEDALPAGERRRAAALLHSGRRRRWVASRWALRHALGSRLDRDPRLVALETSDGGRPVLASAELRFSLSHSGPLALIAVSADCEVGIDVETIRGGRDFTRLSRRFLDRAAAAGVCAAHPDARPQAFYRAWARHEAVCKAGGCAPARSARPGVEVVDLLAPDGFAAALAHEAVLR